VSVLKQLIDKFHAGNYIYYADNLFMPYGNKTHQWLKSRINTLIKEMQDKYNAQYVILACNTASANINEAEYNNLFTMKFNSDLPYVVTELTKKTLSNKNMISGDNLAEQIETHLLNKQKLDAIVKKYVQTKGLSKLKEFILGCTHYELVQPVFAKYCPNSKVFNNSLCVINELNFQVPIKELNIVIKQSKNNEQLFNKIIKLLN